MPSGTYTSHDNNPKSIGDNPNQTHLKSLALWHCHKHDLMSHSKQAGKWHLNARDLIHCKLYCYFITHKFKKSPPTVFIPQCSCCCPWCCNGQRKMCILQLLCRFDKNEINIKIILIAQSSTFFRQSNGCKNYKPDKW